MNQNRCDICNHTLAKGARYGVDRRTTDCATEYYRRYRDANRTAINARMAGYMRARRRGDR